MALGDGFLRVHRLCGQYSEGYTLSWQSHPAWQILSEYPFADYSMPILDSSLGFHGRVDPYIFRMA